MNVKTPLTGLLVGFVASALGCPGTEPNPNHCVFNEGDAFCREFFGEERPFCSWDNEGCPGVGAERGCVAERPSDACYSPCGDGSSYADDPSCEGVADDGATVGDDATTGGSADDGGMTMGVDGSDTGTSGNPTGDPTSATDTGPTGCMGHEDCTDPNLPICDDGMCIGCDLAGTPDEACAEAKPDLPVCGGAGACVQCMPGNAAACTGTTPVCDADALACRGCVEHAECGEAACHIPFAAPLATTPDDGACFDAGAVVHVGQGQAYATIGAALAGVGAGMDATLVLHDGASFDEDAVVDARAVAFLAAEGDEPQWVYTTAPVAATLTVTGDGVAYVEGLRMTGNLSDVGVRVSDGHAHVRRSRVVNNAGGGIEVEASGVLWVDNSFVGGIGQDVVALRVTSGDAGIVASTLVGGNVVLSTPSALTCNAAADVSVRNSIVVAVTTDDEILCDATISYSATEGGAPGMGNVSVSNVQLAAWFTDPASGAFLLTPGAGNTGAATFADIAQWQGGDPRFDLDGDARPDVDGTMDYAGADALP